MDPLALLREAMARDGVDAILISDPQSVAWLTGFSGSFGQSIVTPRDARFLTDSRYTLQASEEVKSMPSLSFSSPVQGHEFIAAQAREMGLTRLGFEAESVPYATYEKWAGAMGGIELVPAPDLVGGLRMVKSPEEVAKIRAACALADAAFERVVRLIQPGVTEFDIGLEIEFFFRRQGAEVAFPPVVASGLRSARPHGRASEKRLDLGDFVTMDFGARLDGYNSDITRTVVVGEPTDRHREVYSRVLEAQLASLDAMRPGVPARDIDAHARRVLGDFAPYFGHGLGHGLGRLVHDSGRMNASSKAILAPGQVWTVEPGVYIDGFGGVRIEDDVVVTEDGIEVLTHSPKDLMALP